MVGDALYAIGDPAGADGHHLDIRCDLEPGEVLELDFGAPEPDGSADVVNPRGEQPKTAPILGGSPMAVRSANWNGAGLDLHLRTRVADLVCDLWLTYYPSQLWAVGELQVTCSNPSSPALVGIVPNDFRLLIQGGHVLPFGLAPDSQLIPGQTTIASGQGWSTIPLAILLPGFTESDAESALAHAQLGVGVLGLRKLWPTGNPLWPHHMPAPLAWANQHIGGAKAYLYGWESYSALSIHENAATTGGEPDQVWVGGALGHGRDSIGTEIIAKLVAYGYARRPVHHLELDGDFLDLDGHPNLCLYNGLPFPQGGATDLLGKARLPTLIERHGWHDWAEHEFANWLFAAYRATGSPALQWQIRAQAQQLLFSATTDRKFTTSFRTGNMREWAWTSLMAWHCWHNLEDRDVAERIKRRYIEYIERAAIPKWGGKDAWEIRSGDPRLTVSGHTDNVIAYQQAIACYFTYLCGKLFGLHAATELALRGAQWVVDYAFSVSGGRWAGWHIVGVDRDKPHHLEHRNGAVFGPGVEAWMVCAPAVVWLETGDAKSRQILDQFIAEANVDGQWIPPEVITA